jgi:2',3'-cyclic-nucleotide 2'-phosphodiesterase (5'-nucleotidase family)
MERWMKRHWSWADWLMCACSLALAGSVGCGGVDARGDASLAVVDPSASITDIPLTVLHTNDFHARLDQTERMAETVALLRQSLPNPLLLDAGDLFESRVPAVLESRGRVLVDFVQRLGYDAITLGDNAFTRIPRTDLRASVSAFGIPVVSANLLDLETGAPSGSPFGPPHVVLERYGLRIGIIGIYAERDLTKFGVRVLDPFDALARSLAALRGKTDCIVVIAHGDKKNLRRIAAEDGVDLLIMGSSHSPAFSTHLENGTPMVRAGAHGSYVGVAGPAIDRDEHSVTLEHAFLVNTQSPGRSLREAWPRVPNSRRMPP